MFLGLQQVPQDTEIVLIHDGVRPFVTEEILERSIAAAKETGGCVAGVPAKDTIKVCDAEALRLPRRTEAPSGRYRLRRPSAERKSLRHTKRRRRTAFLERMILCCGAQRLSCAGYHGSYRNIKITTKEDLLIGAAIFEGGNRMKTVTIIRTAHVRATQAPAAMALCCCMAVQKRSFPQAIV